MGRPDRLCVLCNDHVQETEEPYRTWKTHLIVNVGQAVCIECVEDIRRTPLPGEPPYWQMVSTDERA